MGKEKGKCKKSKNRINKRNKQNKQNKQTNDGDERAYLYLEYVYFVLVYGINWIEFLLSMCI